VTQEVEYSTDDESWPLRLNNYINGNKVIESEKGIIDATGQGKTKMLSKSKKISVLATSNSL
jgi:hypothetical protein|tara:strand:+ start:142 stop:327 length:186 start_codon:yes stop_codon:yes gene_type:complete